MAGARQQLGDFDGSIALFDEVYATLGGNPVAFVPYVPALKALSCVLAGDPRAHRVAEEGVEAAKRSRDPAAYAYALIPEAWSAPLDAARAAVREATRVQRTFGLACGLPVAAAAGFAARFLAPDLAARLLGRLGAETASNASRLVGNPA